VFSDNGIKSGYFSVTFHIYAYFTACHVFKNSVAVEIRVLCLQRFKSSHLHFFIMVKSTVFGSLTSAVPCDPLSLTQTAHIGHERYLGRFTGNVWTIHRIVWAAAGNIWHVADSAVMKKSDCEWLRMQGPHFYPDGTSKLVAPCETCISVRTFCWKIMILKWNKWATLKVGSEFYLIFMTWRPSRVGPPFVMSIMNNAICVFSCAVIIVAINLKAKRSNKFVTLRK
jgi:hypothetical protein